MDHLSRAHIDKGGGVPLEIVAMALVNGPSQDRGRALSEPAALPGRIRITILHGRRNAKAIAIEALQTEGWPARCELGLVTIRSRTW